MLTMQMQMSQNSEAMMLDQMTTKFDFQEYGIDIGHMPQYELFDEQLTVMENIRFVGKLKGLNDKEFQNNTKILV